MAADEVFGGGGNSPVFGPNQRKGGGGGAAGITEVESTDGSIVVTNPTGPTVDVKWNPTVTEVVHLNGGGVLTDGTAEFYAEGGIAAIEGGAVQFYSNSITINGIDIYKVFRNTVLFCGSLSGGEGFVDTYLSNQGPGGNNQPEPCKYPCVNARRFLGITITVWGDTMEDDTVVVILAKNGSPTAVTITIPIGTPDYTQFSNLTTVDFAAGDVFDLNVSSNGIGSINISASLDFGAIPGVA